MVQSVMAVSTSGKVKRDADHTTDQNTQAKRQMPLFARILEDRIEEQADAPRECHTTTYGQNCELRNFLYRQREYHY